MSKEPVLNFTPVQISEFLELMDEHDCFLNIDDCQANKMFSGLAVTMLRILDENQVDILMNKI